MILWGDLETYSEIPLKDGVHRYAENCEIMLFAYAIDDGPSKVWDRTLDKSWPSDLWDALTAPATTCTFHKVDFDRTVLRHQAADPLIDWRIERFHCTMTQALAHSLPGALDKLCTILRVPQEQAKIKRGKELVQLFCKPRPKNQKLRRATRETHPAEWAEFVEYARVDVEAMRAVAKRVPRWNYPQNPRELALWYLDQRINDRGVRIDLDLAQAAVTTLEKEQARLAAETRDRTGGAVDAATQRDALLAHILAQYEVTLPDMKADTLERRIEDQDLPEPVKDLLRIRLMSASNTGSKYNRLLRGTSSDGRLRGLLAFCGAMRTGRWAGRLFQPQNLFRPPKHLKKLIDAGIVAIKAGGADLVVDNVIELVASAVRGSIIAAEGCKLVSADEANIEGRMAAWLAGEEWKLHAFREYDAGIGEDLYKIAYGKSFAVDPATVGDSSDERQIGKVQELMLQYQGGVGAFVTGAETYGIDLEDMADKAMGSIPVDVFAEAERFLAWLYEAPTEKHRKRMAEGETEIDSLLQLEADKLKARLGLTERVFLVCDSLKRLWRRAHPEICAIWTELDTAVRQAIRSPGNWFPVRRVRVRRDRNWLRIELPSGRFLCYPGIQIDADGAISYLGVNQYSRKWGRIKTYGGKLFENITQAASRDVMAENMPAAEAAGYQIILTVHDELVTEAPDSLGFSADDLGEILARVPDWAPGLPLAASGFEAYRYRKD